MKRTRRVGLSYFTARWIAPCRHAGIQKKNTAIQTSEAAKWRNKEEKKNAKNATNRKFCGCCAPLKVYTYEYLLCDRGISVSSNIRTHIHCEHIELSSFVYLDKIHEHFSLRFFSRLSFVCVCVFFFVFDDDTCECVDGVVFSNIPHIFTAFHRWLERFTRVAFLWCLLLLHIAGKF